MKSSLRVYRQNTFTFTTWNFQLKCLQFIKADQSRFVGVGMSVVELAPA